jgi:hypothetical protein
MGTGQVLERLKRTFVYEAKGIPLTFRTVIAAFFENVLLYRLQILLPKV